MEISSELISLLINIGLLALQTHHGQSFISRLTKEVLAYTGKQLADFLSELYQDDRKRKKLHGAVIIAERRFQSEMVERDNVFSQLVASFSLDSNKHLQTELARFQESFDAAELQQAIHRAMERTWCEEGGFALNEAQLNQASQIYMQEILAGLVRQLKDEDRLHAHFEKVNQQISRKLDENRTVSSSHHKKTHEYLANINKFLHDQALTSRAGDDTSIIGLRSIISDITEQEVEVIRNLLHEGKLKEVQWQIEQVRGDKDRWDALDTIVKANILRLDAVCKLELSGDTQHAWKLAEEAESTDSDPNKTKRLQASILKRDGRIGDAIALLQDQNDLDSRNSLASLLLEMQDISGAKAVIDQIDKEFTPNSETYRIKALWSLSQKEIVQAQQHIMSAQIDAGHWWIVRLNAAIINYFSAISPAALPGGLSPWPAPVEEIFVKRDDESIACVLSVIDELNALKELSCSIGRHQLVQAWLLGCMAITPGKLTDAQRIATEMLQEDPVDVRALSWVLATRIRVNLNPSIDSLQKLFDHKQATISHIDALIGCYIIRSDLSAAMEILDGSRELFLDEGASDFWKLRKVQCLLAQDEIDEAEHVIKESEPSEERSYAQTIILAAKAQHSGDSTELIDYFETQFTKSGYVGFLLQACERQYNDKNWDYVAERSVQLLELVGTAQVLQLVVSAHFHVGQFGQCLELLEQNSDLFENGLLPIDMRRYRATCLLETGKFANAIEEFQSIAHQTNKYEDHLNLAQAYYKTGDSKGLAIVGREIARSQNVNPGADLQLATWLRLEDPSLAKTLWQRATTLEIPDDYVGKAIITGFKLRQEHKLGDLSPRFQQLAEEGRSGTFTISIDEYIQLSQQKKDIYDLYNQGKIPIHFFAEQTNTPLVHLLHSNLTIFEQSPNPIRQFPLMAQHGGRVLPLDIPIYLQECRLHMDISALLLAEHLGILGLVESVYAPIFIPSEIPSGLMQMMDAIHLPQPSRIDVAKEIVNLVDQGKIKVYELDPKTALPSPDFVDCGLLELASQRGGYVVEFFERISRYETGNKALLVDDITVVRVLTDKGKITRDECISAVEVMGYKATQADDGTTLEQEAELLLYYNVAGSLSEAGVLRQASDTFRIFIDQNYLDEMRRILKVEGHIQNVTNWLDELRERIRTGIDNNTYQIVIVSHKEVFDDDTSKTAPNDFGLLSLFRFEVSDNDVLWVDDRFTNAYNSRDNKAAIVGIVDILHALRCAEKIEEVRYFDALRRLRAGNMYNIPLYTDEIIYHLKNAPIQEDALVETRDLLILKNYSAAVLAHGEFLQSPPMPKGAANVHGEIAFILQTHRAIGEALIGIWSDPSFTNEIQVLYSNWIHRNLFIDLHGYSESMGMERNDTARWDLIVATLVTLLANGLLIPPQKKAGNMSNQGLYMQWLETQILANYFPSHERLFQRVAKQLITQILETRSIIQQEFTDYQFLAIISGFITSLPPRIRQEIVQDPQSLISLGIKSLIAIGKYSLGESDFWEALVQNAHGDVIEITPVNHDEPIRFEPFTRQDGKVLPSLYDAKKNARILIEDTGFELMSGPEEEWLEFLHQKRDWFDISDNEYIHAIDAIASETDPQIRAETLLIWKQSRLTEYYQALNQKLKTERAFHFDDLVPPDVKGLLRFYRISEFDLDSSTIQEALNSSSKEILGQYGLLEVLLRFLPLPIPLPLVIVRAFADQSLEEQKHIIKYLLSIACTPVAVSHLLYLLVRVEEEASAFWRLARWIIKQIIDVEGNELWQAFYAVLNWVERTLDLALPMQNEHVSTKLVFIWAHAHYLFSMFISLGAPLPWINKYFELSKPKPFRAFDDQRSFFQDVAHPRNVDIYPMTIAILAYAISADTEIVTKEIRELFQNAFIIENDGQRLAHPFLFANPLMGHDALNSFLHIDRGQVLIPFLGERDAKIFSSVEHNKLFGRAVENLGQQYYARGAWLDIYALIGGFTIPMEFQSHLIDLISEIDYAELIEDDTQTGLFTIHLAAIFAHRLKDETLHGKLSQQIRLIATKVAERDDLDNDIQSQEADTNADVALLTETIYKISTITQQGEEAVQDFVSMMITMFASWPQMGSYIQDFIQLLCEITSPSLAKHLWKLLCRIRSIC